MTTRGTSRMGVARLKLKRRQKGNRWEDSFKIWFREALQLRSSAGKGKGIWKGDTPIYWFKAAGAF